MTLSYEDVIARLRALANPEDAEGMSRFGIQGKEVLGIRIPELRKLAKEIKKNHQLALQLWDSGIHEARILATMIDDPKKVSEEQMDVWAAGFDSWDVCDQACGNLFDKTPYAYDKAVEWSGRDEEFAKRAAFALMAWLAVHDKKKPDEAFEPFFGIIERESADERNFVKKAANWALRQIGKRSVGLNKQAIACAERMALIDSKAARWNAADALKELRSEKVRKKIGK